MKKVLVTGASGFLGIRVVARLRAWGCDVTTLARHAGDLQADLADTTDAERVLTPWRWDVCVQLAAPVTGGNEDMATGIGSTLVHARIGMHVRRLARGRIVHASSMTVYGLPRQIPVAEDHARIPVHLYGLGKVLAEDILLAEPSLPVVVLRFGGLFGDERRSGALFHFFRAALAGTPLRVTTPTPTPWELLHVDDAAEGIALAATLPDIALGAINLGYGEPIELVAMARRIAAMGGRGSTVETILGVCHPVFQLDISRARASLSWNPPSLESRLAGLLEAFAS